jgi:Protein of unknown function (DUF2510)
MSQVSPGWYPDPSGRFAQRYHDGSRWTEHVADAQGNRDTDAPVGQAGPASYADSAQHAQHYGQAGQRSSDPYGQQSAGAERGYGGRSAREQYRQDVAGSERGYDPGVAESERGYGGRSAREQYDPGVAGPERGYDPGVTGSERGYDPGVAGPERGYDQWTTREREWGQERPGPSRSLGDPRAEAGWDQAGGRSWQARGGAPAARNEWSQASGATQPVGDGGAAAGRPVAGRDWRAADRGQGPARYDTGPHYGQPAGYGQPAAYRDPGYADAPSGTARGFTPTIGLVVAGVGAVLLLLSLFGLNFLELSFPGLSRSVSLGDIAGDFGEGAPAALATYADFGRYLAVLVAVFALLAVVRVVPQLRDIAALPAIVAVVCGAFAIWHALAMLASADEGVDVSPTFGAILGLLGYVALAAGPFLRQPLQARR